MSTPTVQRRSWTRRDYDRLVECGALGPEDKVELLDGEIWEMTPQGTRHVVARGAVRAALSRVFGEGFYLRDAEPFALDDRSEPEPDIAVVEGEPFDYLAGHPSKALLLVEVSESSLTFDRGRKLAAYARNAVPEYWILDLTANALEVYRQPHGETYADKQVLTRDDAVSPLAAPEARIDLREVIPPR